MFTTSTNNKCDYQFAIKSLKFKNFLFLKKYIISPRIKDWDSYYYYYWWRWFRCKSGDACLYLLKYLFTYNNDYIIFEFAFIRVLHLCICCKCADWRSKSVLRDLFNYIDGDLMRNESNSWLTLTLCAFKDTFFPPGKI